MGLLCQYSIHGRVLGHVYSQNVFCGLGVEPKPTTDNEGVQKRAKRFDIETHMHTAANTDKPIQPPTVGLDSKRRRQPRSVQCSVRARPRNGDLWPKILVIGSESATTDG